RAERRKRRHANRDDQRRQQSHLCEYTIAAAWPRNNGTVSVTRTVAQQWRADTKASFAERESGDQHREQFSQSAVRPARIALRTRLAAAATLPRRSRYRRIRSARRRHRLQQQLRRLPLKAVLAILIQNTYICTYGRSCCPDRKPTPRTRLDPAL